MGSKVKRSTNNIPRLTKTLQKLGKAEIKVGVFGEDSYEYGNDADLVTIAYVHEYGMTIKPKKGKYLTIPTNPKAKGKSAREFTDLVFIPIKNGNGLLVRKKDKDDFEIFFVLVKSVDIPERSFLRTGFDENVGKVADKVENMLNDVLDFNIDPDIFLDAIGLEFAGLIQKHMRNIDSPPNSGATKETKGSSNPLHDTGRLIGSIRHKVE